MTEPNKPKQRGRVPLWFTITLSVLGALALAVAAQVSRYASGTALTFWYVACGAVIAANLIAAPVRQWLTEQSANISLSVDLAEQTSIPDSNQAGKIVSDWTENMRASLLESLDNYEPPAEEIEGRDFVRLAPGGARFLLPTDERTPDDYRTEVENYLKEGRDYLIRLMAANYTKDGHGNLPLVIVSGNSGTLEGVRVRVWTENTGATLYNPEDVDYPEAAPKRPVPFGQATNPRAFRNTLGDLRFGDLAPSYAPYLGPSIEEHPDGGLVFPDVEVRRGEYEHLPLIAIAYRGDPSRTLTIKWSATAKNAPGSENGSFTVRIRASDIDPRLLTRRPEERD